MTRSDAPVRILGVDPGSTVTGWGVIEANGSDARLIECGSVRVPRAQAFAARLDRLHRAIVELTCRFSPTIACVEAPFHGVNARSALQLAHARGVVLAALAGAGIDVDEIAPATVKRAVAGHGRADKAQVALMIGRILGVRDDWESSDVSDAVAVAYCAAMHRAHASSLVRAGAVEASKAARATRRRGGRAPVVRRVR